ncbi:hypothetical protein AAFX91_42020 [Bradyrhizobium sp. 31Argb]|uniref:hypothetical protein n=1 Tax=Bradyrhizobium TaxID=374 RepID=UPI000422598B|nr:hypothetical protein CWO90_46525 [Bradyrhizobium sp. Leo121]TAI59841.1 hypothetical protein CWO89_44025 [Bradyrhizobium sp. Leo170]
MLEGLQLRSQPLSLRRDVISVCEQETTLFLRAFPMVSVGRLASRIMTRLAFFVAGFGIAG